MERLTYNIGIKNPNYKHGKYSKNYKNYCIDCGNIIANPNAKRCRKCYINNFMKITTKAPHYKSGLPKCKDCGKQLNRYASKRCRSCSEKLKGLKKKGKNNPNYIHGQSNLPYPLEFNSKLKYKIRQRDNFECQNCGMTEEEHLIAIGRALDVHHIDYNKFNCKENNLITLCNQCNVRANYNRKEWIKHFDKIIRRNQYVRKNK